MILILLVVIFLGMLYGFREGMVMTQIRDFASIGQSSGVRSHVSFPFYHAINSIYHILLVTGVIMLYRTLSHMSLGNYIFMVFGLVITAWRFSELAYSFSRFGRWIRYEHINFFDLISFRLRDNKVIYWNFAWCIIAVVFLLVGGR